MNPLFASPLARGAAIVLLACALTLSSGGVHAQSGPPTTASERSVKAAYIYRFLAYVEWPSATLPASAPIVIGVLGADDVADELEQIARTRPAGHRPIAVRRLDAGDSWLGVHVLYAARETAGRVIQVMKALQDRSVLTISDAERAVQRGFVIGLVDVESKLRFEVSSEAAERSGLKLSSRLLTVALSVHGGGR